MIYNYGPIANPNNDYYKDFIYVHVGDSVVSDIFEGTGMDHSELVSEIDSLLKPRSFNTGKVVTVKMSNSISLTGRGAM